LYLPTFDCFLAKISAQSEACPLVVLWWEFAVSAIVLVAAAEASSLVAVRSQRRRILKHSHFHARYHRQEHGKALSAVAEAE